VFNDFLSSKLAIVGGLNELLYALSINNVDNLTLWSLSPTLLVLNNLELATIDSGFRPLDDSLSILTRTLVKYGALDVFSNLVSSFASYLVILMLVYTFLIIYFFNNNKLNTSEVAADNDYLSL
jgi:hypothetical protein